jgi:hypothetical protein
MLGFDPWCKEIVAGVGRWVKAEAFGEEVYKGKVRRMTRR